MKNAPFHRYPNRPVIRYFFSNRSLISCPTSKEMTNARFFSNQSDPVFEALLMRPPNSPNFFQ